MFKSVEVTCTDVLTVLKTKGEANLIQLDLGTRNYSIHIKKQSSDATYTNNQVLQLEYTLVISNYTSIGTAVKYLCGFADICLKFVF